MDEVSGYFDFAEVQAIRHRPMYIRKNIYRPESLQWLAIKGKAVRIQFMKGDMTVPCGDGMINIRVGAIILKDGKFLMAGNERSDYLYSVGGRVKFGETAQEAVVREVPEHFLPVSGSFTEDESREYLRWVSAGDEGNLYPEFFRTELLHPQNTVNYFLTDERRRNR